MLSLRRNPSSKNLDSTLSAFRCLLYSSSTIAAVPEKPSFVVDYLVHSLGFSASEAISASKKVKTHLKSTQNPDLVIDLFKRYGFEQSQIKPIIYKMPELLLSKPDKTLQPKFEAARELGLSGSDLVRFIHKHRQFFRVGLATRIVPIIRLLRELMGSDENVVKALNRSNWLFTSAETLKRLPSNVNLLTDFGLSNEIIGKLLALYPRVLMVKPEHLQDTVRRVEEELRIPRDSSRFFLGISTLSCVDKSSLEMKFGIFRSFGWPDSDIYTMARNLPNILSKSEAALSDSLNFYMNELCFSPAYLASQPPLLTYSLEKRVKPRFKVKKILEDSGINCKFNLYTVLKLSEEMFVEKYIFRYEKEVPDLHAKYRKFLEQ